MMESTRTIQVVQHCYVERETFTMKKRKNITRFNIQEIDEHAVYTIEENILFIEEVQEKTASINQPVISVKENRNKLLPCVRALQQKRFGSYELSRREVP